MGNVENGAVQGVAEEEAFYGLPEGVTLSEEARAWVAKALMLGITFKLLSRRETFSTWMVLHENTCLALGHHIGDVAMRSVTRLLEKEGKQDGTDPVYSLEIG